MNSTTRTRSSNSSIRFIRLRSIRDGKEAVRSGSTIDTKMEELTNQGIPTSRQEEEVNGNSRKGEPGVPGKEGDYIVEWRGAGDWMYIIGRTCSITTGLRIWEKGFCEH